MISKWLFFGMLMLFGVTLFAQPPVQVTGPMLPSLRDGAIAWGDLDGDGNPELLISGSNVTGAAETVLLRNSGPLLTIDTLVSSGLAQLRGGDAVWVDLDGDGDKDLVMTGDAAGNQAQTVFYRNQAGSLIAVAVPTIPGLRLGRLAVADMDLDGDQDVVFTGFNIIDGYVGMIARNDGNWNFTAIRPSLFEPKEWSSLGLGDYNGDGLIDIAYASNSPSLLEGMRTVILRNLGGLQFGNVPTTCPGTYDGDLQFGNLDGQSSLELLVTGTGVEGYSGVLGLQSGQFVEIQRLDSLGFSAAMWIDFDQDGDEDVITAGMSWNGLKMHVFRNQNGVLSLYQGPGQLPALYHVRLAKADWNGDGYLDFAVLGQDANDQAYCYIATYNTSTQQFKF